MKCADCGSENRAGAKFCAKCGKPLPMGEPELQPAAEGPSRAPAEEAPVAVEEGAPGETEAMEAAAKPAEAEEAVPGTGAVEQEAKPPVPEGAPLAAETRLLDRYEIIELSESTPEGNVYAAYDLRRCPQCDFAGNEPGSEYCSECGATLGQGVKCIIRQSPSTEGLPIADQFTVGDAVYTVTLEKTAASEAVGPAFPHGVRLRWGQKTDVGRAREVNEDYLDVRVYAPHAGPVLGLFVVADGVGGQEHGEVASQLATRTIWDQVREEIWKPEMTGERILPETMKRLMVEAVQAANQAVYNLRVERRSDMGTTLTMALLRDNLAVIANVGDSRAYLWSSKGLQRLTVDHSVVENLVKSGSITREQVYTHPQRNLIYRSLGDRPTVEVDTFIQELQPGDRLLLCSDGLWEMVRDEGIEEALMREAAPQVACDLLVDQANLAGGEDNITVIIVQIEDND